MPLHRPIVADGLLWHVRVCFVLGKSALGVRPTGGCLICQLLEHLRRLCDSAGQMVVARLKSVSLVEMTSKQGIESCQLSCPSPRVLGLVGGFCLLGSYDSPGSPE